MAAAGNSIGCHGMTHSILKNLTRGELERELKDSKNMLEDKLGFEVKALSIPRGFYDEMVIDVARESGYRAVFTSDTGYNSTTTGLYELRRIVMRNDYSFNDFKAIIDRDLRFRITRELESRAKKMLQKILGVKSYDSLKSRYLNRRGI
jgi:peptidoglycan/xylan/chitin deacetylase (PgdA/CDA1 family)